MSPFLCLVLACPAQITPDLATTASPEAAETSADVEGRAFHEIEAEMRDHFKKEAVAKTLETRAPSVMALAGLHGEIVSHPRYVISDTLKKYRIQIWSRLIRVKRKLKSQVAREAKANGGKAPSEQETSLANDASIAIGEQLAIIQNSLGGPGYLLASQQAMGRPGAGGGAAIAAANGQDLIELIERTINPEFWDTNGGPGSIFYFAPLHALVVRATSEVHHRLGGVVDQVRRVNQ